MCRASGVRTNGAVAPTVLCDHVAAARGSFGTLGRQRSVSQLATPKIRTNRDRRHDGEPERVVRRLLRGINRRDTESLMQLMTNDHVLIDSLGHRLSGGPGALRAAWAGDFGMVPDYQIKAKAIFAQGNSVIIVGVASGCYLPSTNMESLGTWETPGAWRAVVRRGRVAEWQVYADNEPIRELMRHASTRRV